jgi:hypothetical protein
MTASARNDDPMARMPLRLVRATVEDADAIAAVYSASFRLLTFLPSLHTVAEDRRFIEDVILRQYEVTLPEDASGIVSFMALGGELVRLLYTRPDRIGKGAGTLLDRGREVERRCGAGAVVLSGQHPARGASTKRAGSVPFASRTAQTTRNGHPTCATAGSEPASHRRERRRRELAEPHEPCGRSNPRGPYET